MEGGRLMAPRDQEQETAVPAGRDLARRIIMVAGAPGSGKTELSGMIARATGYPRLEKDLLTGASPDRERSYRTLMDLAADIAANGSSVILDAGFLPELATPGWLQRQQAGFALLGARLEVVLVESPQAMRLRRMRQRGWDRDLRRVAQEQPGAPMAPAVQCTVTNAEGIYELLEQAGAVVAGLELKRDS